MSRLPEGFPRHVSAIGVRPGRRRLIASGAALLLLVSPLGRAVARAAAPSVIAVRIWPAEDYTRVTLEHDQPIKFTHFLVRDPDRLVIDLEGVEFNGVLDGLARKLTADDPYIRLLRAGRYKPGVVRVVMDLKTAVAPQVFTLAPVANYGHRLVLDIYPATPRDPLLALLQQQQQGWEPKDEIKLEPQADAISRKIEDLAARPGEQATAAAAPEAARPKALENSETSGVQGGDPMTNASPATANAEPDLRPQAKRKGRAIVDRLVTITLDPGHGGEDPGAVGRGGSYEKNVTLAVARRLKAKIDAEPNMRAVLTRDADFFVPLHVRVQKARRLQSDLFVSIHADAWIKPDARGSSVFVLSDRGASSAAARWLAQKENDADLIGGINTQVKDPHLARTLLDLSQTATINDSLKLGKAVLGELGGINRLHKASVEQAGFAVLKAPDIPSILVETAFISNPEEEKRLNDEAYQERMAEAMLSGIRKYFAKNPPAPKSKLARS